MEKIQRLREILKNNRRICVFTGAGISVPSGIPDFRSAQGIYSERTHEQYRPEDMISHSFFEKHPEMFYEFYKSKMLYPQAKPNAAHRFFARLEEQGKEVTVVTQNIDGLHQAAGSTNVFELHGSVHRNHCPRCGRFFTMEELLARPGTVPHCPADGTVLKPDVVLYEEPLDDRVVRGALRAIDAADTMVIIGTSLVVYPAAAYVRYFSGEHLVLINKTPTPMDHEAEIAIYDDVVHVVEQLTEERYD
ncbi:MAG: NAD-dependent protein deacylase [Clostridia bacterium]|nr:NAD-dependent protein deacylase [Clostridia bacterium]